MGFEKVVEVLLQFIDLFRCWTIVTEGSVNVIFTLGRVTRVLHPGYGRFKTGFYFKAPFNIQKDEEVSVKEDVGILFNQDVMTSDGMTVRISGTFRLQVLPEKADIWLTTLGDEGQAVPAMLRAAVAETIIRWEYKDLMSKEDLKGLKQEILERARKELNRYGYKVYDFWWAERTAGKTYRLITGE